MSIIIERKAHPFYPLVVFCTATVTNETTGHEHKSRWIECNRLIGKHHDQQKIHILYGRQIGKIQARKMKPLMELPYIIKDNCCAADVCYSEIERWKWEKPYTDKINGAKKPAIIDALSIVDAELEAEA